MESCTTFKRYSTHGSLKSFWYYHSWSFNCQTACLWILKSVFKINKKLLSNHWQRTKVNLSLNSWLELILGVLQGPALGPLLFNIYIHDLVYLNELTGVRNYADGTAFHACDSNLEDVIRRSEHDPMLAIEWFESNYIKLNQDKLHLLLYDYKHEVMFAKIGHKEIWESGAQKLGIIIDQNLKFDECILTQCKKAGRKIKHWQHFARIWVWNLKEQ